jgi:mono/diheme cytochrome c family protein
LHDPCFCSGDLQEYDDTGSSAIITAMEPRVTPSMKCIRRPRRPLTLIGVLAVAFAIASAFSIDHQASTAAEPQRLPAAGAGFDPLVVAKGAWLAAIGNCNSCHTANDGATFAGGRPLSTPFGTIYATNITPDPETGIGRWSATDFLRAMHQGVDREGRNLYPAFPYDHFTHVADDDVNAIYAFLMTRDPASAHIPANSILVPRAAIGVWKALYFKPGPLAPDAAHDERWNRGRYLVDGLGHCGGCHTPRNALGAEKEQEDLAGSTIEGWRAPALNESSPAPARWTVEQITTYLRSGFDAAHGTAAGSMAPVAHNLSDVPETEVGAIAVYIASRMAGSASGKVSDARGAVGAERSEHDGETPIDPRQANDGDAIYRSACAGCHDGGRRGIALEWSTSTTDASPTNLIRITLDGIHPREGEKGGVMPTFRGALDDTQLASLVAFVRASMGHAAPWRDVAGEVAKAKHGNVDGKPP